MALTLGDSDSQALDVPRRGMLRPARSLTPTSRPDPDTDTNPNPEPALSLSVLHPVGEESRNPTPDSNRNPLVEVESMLSHIHVCYSLPLS